MTMGLRYGLDYLAKFPQNLRVRLYLMCEDCGMKDENIMFLRFLVKDFEMGSS